MQTDVERPPQTTGDQDRPNTRAALFAIAAVAGLAELAYAIMNVSAMPVYLKFSVHYSVVTVTRIGIAFLLCEGILKGPFGILGDRIGRKTLMIGGPLISVFTSLLTLLVHPSQWYLFVLLRALDGMGAAALWPSALAMIADVVDEERRSQAMSLFNVTYLVGVALGPFVGGVANDTTAILTEHVRSIIRRHGPKIIAIRIPEHTVDPYSASFYVVSALFLMTALVAWRWVPNVRPHHERHASEVEGGFSFRALVVSLREMPQMMLMALVTFLGIGMVMLIVKLFAMAEFNVSEMRFGALLLVPCLIIAAASVPLGTLGDWLGRVRAIRLGIGLCALSMWALIFFRNEWALVIGGSFIGVGFVIAFPAWMAYISGTCDPRQRGAIMGAFGTAQGLGAMIGALLGGYLYEHARIHIPWLPWINSHYVPFICCAGLLLTAWIMAMTVMHETPRRAGAA